MLQFTSLYRTGLAGERFTVQTQIVDVALSGNFVGSQTQVAACDRAFGPFLPPVSRVQDNVIIFSIRRNPDGFKNLCRWVALFGDRTAIE